MKRYKPTLTAGTTNEFPNGWVPYMAEQDDGEWVKWEDVEKEKFAGIANAIIIIAADLEKKRLKEPVCNCAKMTNAPPYNHGTSLNLTAFICPSHGYKKL